MREKPSESLKEIVLLYVEDDDEVREALGNILRRYVNRLLLASNGKEGLALFLTEQPDIVISDIRMPVMDGLTMAGHIKEVKKETAILFTTAFGESEYLKRAIEMGVEGYLIKPIDRNRLIAKLNYLADALVNERRKQTYLRLLASIFDAQKEAVALMTRRGDILLSNVAYKRLCLKIGCEDDAHFASMAGKFSLKAECAKADGEDLIEWLKKSEGETVCLDINGVRQFYELHTRDVDDLLFLEMIDVSRYRQNELRLEHESMADALTGLYNRKILPKIVMEAAQKPKVCCLLCDLDHFKEVNDLYGHARGDAVLKEVAALIRSKLRQNDYLLRWGGEEFLAVLDGDIREAMSVAQKLRRAVEETQIAQLPAGKVTVSIGVCCAKIKDLPEFETLFEKTDQALYKAKHLGRNRVEGCA